MLWRELTAVFVAAVIVVVIVYDLIAYAFGGNSATISRVFLDLSEAQPGWLILASFAVGVLYGHAFLPQHK